MNIELKPNEVEALDRLAVLHGMTHEGVMRQALRTYQMFDMHIRQGQKLVWKWQDGSEVKEPVGGCMGDD